MSRRNESDAFDFHNAKITLFECLFSYFLFNLNKFSHQTSSTKYCFRVLWYSSGKLLPRVERSIQNGEGWIYWVGSNTFKILLFTMSFKLFKYCERKTLQKWNIIFKQQCSIVNLFFPSRWMVQLKATWRISQNHFGIDIKVALIK